MSRSITIDPVTRIEGHAKITLQLDDAGHVSDARLHVTQLRGFEKFCEGRPFHEMPALMARICGICPVSHLLASAKACDALLAVTIPPTAAKLRLMINLAQIAQSHALSFFYLSSPDLLLGMDADPAQRNLFKLAAAHPQVAQAGVHLRATGQKIIEILGGKRIHPTWIVPGGVSDPLTAEKRDAIAAMIPDAIGLVVDTLDDFKERLPHYANEIQAFAHFPSLYLGLIGEGGALELYDGRIRITNWDDDVIADDLAPERYMDYLGEHVEPESFLKSPYYKPFGYPTGIYRVGPLARLNVVTSMGTPLAQTAWEDFRRQDRNSAFMYHYARLIEILYCYEKIAELLDAPDILDTHVRAFAAPNRDEGIGVSEAPRGTLIHHYKIDRDGLMTYANLIIATGHNNLAMNRGILQAAQQFVRPDHLTEGMLNRVEAVIRAFDPCLSCSTHAYGDMTLRIVLQDAGGHVIDEARR
jgi:NAD-reducing hydrogenase large subunit